MAWFGKEEPYILVAEDENIAAAVMITILEKNGYKTKRALDGDECLKMVRKSRPLLVLLDVMMPKIDGSEVLRQIKSDPQTKDIPIVMCTALSGVADVEKYFKHGASGYVTKPFDNERLIQKINSLLKKS